MRNWTWRVVFCVGALLAAGWIGARIVRAAMRPPLPPKGGVEVFSPCNVSLARQDGSIVMQEQWTEVDRLIAGMFAPSDPGLAATLRASAEAGPHSIHISPNQGKLLQLLARGCLVTASVAMKAAPGAHVFS